MDNKLKNELEMLFEKDKQRVAAVQKEASAQSLKEAASLAKFIKIREEIITPAMKEISEFATAHGWNCRITSNEEFTNSKRGTERAGLSLTFTRGTSRSRDSQTPNFSVFCNKTTDSADFHESTIGEGHGGSAGGAGSIKLDSITVDVVQAKLVKYLAKLLEDAKPSIYRP